jgi:hypothetical protein
MFMIEKIPLEFKKWSTEHISPDKLGISLGGTDTLSQMHRYSTPDGNQQFNVLEVDGRPEGREGPTIISGNSWNYRLDPLVTYKMRILAKQRGARIFMSELPGVTINHANPLDNTGARQTREQFLGAFRGNFNPLSKMQLEAVDSFAHFEEGEDVQFFGESLASYSVASMASVISKGDFKPLHISKMELVEPVNAYGDTSLIHMAKMMNTLGTVEDTRRGIYIGENKKIGYPEAVPFEQISLETAAIDKYVKGVRRQLIPVLASGGGLRKGVHTMLGHILSADAEYAPLTSDSSIIVSRGADSTVTNPRHFEQLAGHVRESGISVRLVEFTDSDNDYSEEELERIDKKLSLRTPIGHSTLDSLGRMATYASVI